MIDLHSHVLPGLDDGPATMPEAVDLARAAAAAGTTTLVATPHVNHSFGVQPADVARGVDALRRALARDGVDLDVRTGGEIALARLTDLTPEELDGFRLGGGPYLLVESPHSATVGDFDLMLFELRRRGEHILLAHPERCPTFQHHPDRLVRLVEMGVLCSITAGSMAGRFGETVRRFTMEILREGLVHDVASDTHDVERRPPAMMDCFVRAEAELPGIAEHAEWFTDLVPAAILSGEPIPERPSLPVAPLRRRGLFRRRA
jgi:protein-tyrosine phosphatase